MLKSIKVKNFAIIENLDLEFSQGLNILTGETGAGKSIIIGALGIVLGERAYTEMIMTGRDSATVEAFFDITKHPVLEEMGIDSTKGIHLKRTISRAGKTRAYINDTVANLQGLGRLGAALVDVHGQHEHQSLLSRENQLTLLDHFGGLRKDREEVGSLFDEVSKIRFRLDDLRLGTRERAQKADMLRFQADEIEAAGLAEGEDARLEEELEILGNLTRLKELVETSYALIYGDEGSAVERLSRAAEKLREMAGIDAEAAGPLETMEQALPIAEDAAFSIRDLRDRYDLDPNRLEQVQERLRAIDNLKKKYGETIEEITEFGQKAREELEMIEGASESTEALEEELEKKSSHLRKAASALSSKRKRAAVSLETDIMKVLKGLAFEKADFKASFAEADMNSTGMDEMEFLFSANKGETPKPLSKVASGGELSRIMLAIKTVLRKVDDIPVLIFDEVDAGIGGKTARNVAERLKESSTGRQVLCITHLPQIASAADVHYLIEKSSSGKRVDVSVSELSGQKRVEEIARMLSGKVTEASLKHARELMGSA